MMKYKLLLLTLCLVFAKGFTQNKFSKYKYVIVPNEYEFQDEENSYRINELVAHLFSSKGFDVIMSNEEYPIEYRANRCSALTAKLNRDSKLMSVQMQITLVDCNNKVVYTSPWGKSREKDYKKSYHEAIRRAFEDFDGIHYEYDPNPEPELAVENPKAEIKDAIVNKPIAVLYAQPKEKGYQLIDDTPKVVFKISETSKKNVYAIEGYDGLIYESESGVWIAEYYRDEELVIEEYNVKF